MVQSCENLHQKHKDDSEAFERLFNKVTNEAQSNSLVLDISSANWMIDTAGQILIKLWGIILTFCQEKQNSRTYLGKML